MKAQCIYNNKDDFIGLNIDVIFLSQVYVYFWPEMFRFRDGLVGLNIVHILKILCIFGQTCVQGGGRKNYLNFLPTPRLYFEFTRTPPQIRTSPAPCTYLNCTYVNQTGVLF